MFWPILRCVHSVTKCSDENADMNRLKHCYFVTECTQRKMGQNIFHAPQSIDGRCASTEEAIESWYMEVESYNFDDGGYQAGTAQFTAIVWYDTTHVGMARSADGQVFAANYFPPGNWAERENFRMNVLPLKAAYEWRPRNDFERALADHFGRIARDIGSEPMVVPTGELQEALERLGEDRLAEAISRSDLDRNGCVD